MSTTAYRCGTIAIIGLPNAGKSTLMNAMIGQKISITSRRPQTTRQCITGILSTQQGQIIFLDTPGFQSERPSKLHRAMTRSITRSLHEADAVLWLVDATSVSEGSMTLPESIPDGKPLIVAINKVDRLGDKSRLLEKLQHIQERHRPAAIIPISARTGYQLDILREALIRELPERERLYDEDDLTTVASRILAAEMVREKLFRAMGAEIPYAIAVETERFEENNGLFSIQATIFVDKDSQKAIVIGSKGATLKTIGTQARKDLEKLLGGKVYLDLWVKVRRGWSDNPASLRRIGVE